MSDDSENRPKGRRGFASMSPEKQREIARKGGKAVPKEKRSFSANRALATEAGRKGGLATPPEKRSFATNRQLATEAGRYGGTAPNKKAPSGDQQP